MDQADDREAEDRTTGAHGAQPGDAVGLGHVVANEAGLGGGADPGPRDGTDVEEASEDSFPASDPPGFMSDPVTPAEPARRAATDFVPPDPRDVP